MRKDKKQDHKEEIVTQWFESYYQLLCKKAYEIVNDYDLVKDMIQEAFVKIIANFDRINSLSEEERIWYIVGIVKNVSIRYMKKSNKEMIKMAKLIKYEKDKAIDSNVFFKDVYHKKDFLIDLAADLKRLQKLDAMLIIYRHLWGMSSKEIAEHIGIKEEYVNIYVSRAMKRLIKLMKEE